MNTLDLTDEEMRMQDFEEEAEMERILQEELEAQKDEGK